MVNSRIITDFTSLMFPLPEGIEELPLIIDARGMKVLIISDLHEPYSHPWSLDFLGAIKMQLAPDLILNVGDEGDFHGINFHDKETELFSAGHELDKMIERFRDGHQNFFPQQYFCESNHGSMLLRRMKHHGIPVRALKDLNQLYECPLWSWHHEILLLTDLGWVYICHGKTGAYGKLMKEIGCSAVQGHFHGKFEITWHKTAMGKRFNMFTGCLVDHKSLAMRYGKNNIPKPIHGLGWIEENGWPKLIPMLLDSQERWRKKLVF
jgi:hypothetical protein